MTHPTTQEALGLVGAGRNPVVRLETPEALAPGLLEEKGFQMGRRCLGARRGVLIRGGGRRPRPTTLQPPSSMRAGAGWAGGGTEIMERRRRRTEGSCSTAGIEEVAGASSASK